MSKKKEKIEIYGLEYYHINSNYATSFNMFCQEFDKLINIPPSQFDDDGAPLVLNETRENLEQYQIGYIDTVKWFQEYVKKFDPDSWHDPIQKLIDQVLNKLDGLDLDPRDKSEEWYLDGAQLACFDILDGTTI